MTWNKEHPNYWPDTIHICDTDIPTRIHVRQGIALIKGIGLTLSKKICNTACIGNWYWIGDLESEQLLKIINIIKKYRKYKRLTLLTGIKINKHYLEMISKLQKLNSYRGLRHKQRLPVRGQRTRSNAQTQRKLNIVRYQWLNYKNIKKKEK